MPPATADHGRAGSHRPCAQEAGGLGFRVFLCRAAVRALLAGALTALLLPIAPAQEPDGDPAGLHALYYGSHLTEDRSIARELERAVELLGRQRYSAALPILDKLLAADHDVFFLDATADGRKLGISVKARVRELVDDLTPEGREAYLLLFEAPARRGVKSALEQHDYVALSRIVARYEHTPAGEEGAVILAQIAADRGDFDEATRRIARLMDLPTARQRWGDYLHLRAAEWAARQGDQNAADSHLAASSLRGEEVQNLRQILTASPPMPLQSSADRNPRTPHGTPHLWERWRARVVVDRRLETQLAERRGRRSDSLLSTPPLSAVIAVGDLVVARSLNHLVAIDWNTGKRIWETRPEADAWLDASQEQLTAYADDAYSRGRLHPLLLRLWKDAVFASLSTDGRCVFAIRDLDYATAAMNTRFGLLPGFPDASDRQSRVTNRLAAYSIAAEGKIDWEIDGAKPDHSLSGAFFLGAPVALAGSLFAVAEIDSEIYLLELSSGDGRLLWKQPLVSLERGVDQDVGRRLAGAGPSYRNGVLVCPTGAGVVIGVDPFHRALKWSFRVPVQKDLVDQQDDLLQRRAYGTFRLLNNQWLDARAILSDDYAVITLPESPDLFCLELATGALAWSRPRGEGMYVGGMTKTQVVVVGKQELSSLQLSDGSPQWTAPMPDGHATTGRGLLCGDQFCLPLDSGRLAVIDLHSGNLTQLLQTHTGQPIGNLVAHRGTVLSQTLGHVDRFDHRQQLEREVAERLAAGSGDAVALRLAGELAETAGNSAEALELFKKAHFADPADPLAKERVVDALLTAVKGDYSRYHSSIELLESLADDPLLRLEVLRLKADGLAAEQDFAAAFACYLSIYEAAVDHDDLWLDLEHGAARVDRWFNGGLARLWHASDPETKAEIVEAVEDLKPPKLSLESSSAIGPLERYVRYFSGLPSQESARMELADLYRATGRRRDAELAWMQLIVGEDRRTRERARGRLLSVNEPTELETLPETGPMAAAPASVRRAELWPAVQIAAEENHRRRSRASRRPNSENEGTTFTPLHFQSALLPELGPAAFAMATNGNELIAWDTDGDVVIRGSVEASTDRRQPNRGADVLRGGRMGHFVFLSHGDQTTAVDAAAATTQDNLQMWSRSGRWSGRRTLVARDHIRRTFEPDQAQLMAVSPFGIVLLASGVVYCVHPVTGELEWSQPVASPSSRVYADTQRVFLLESGHAAGKILSITDGMEIGTWQLPSAPLIESAGCRVLTEIRSEDAQVYQVVDLATGDVELERSMQHGTKAASFGPGWVALLAPSGHLEVIELNLGTVAFAHDLAAEPNLRALEIFPLGEQWFLLTRTLSDADQSLAGYSAPAGGSPATGRLYALEAATGSLLWPQPAVVTGRVVLPLQPPASPALVLASFRASPEQSRGDLQAELLAIDRATGQTVYRSTSLTHALPDSIVMHLERRPGPVLHIDSQQWSVVLRSTATPRAPEPVAHDEVESLHEQNREGLWGVGRQLGRVLEEVLRGADR